MLITMILRWMKHLHQIKLSSSCVSTLLLAATSYAHALLQTSSCIVQALTRHAYLFDLPEKQ